MPTSSSHILEFRNVTKSFGGVHALKALNLRIPAGTVLGIVGANGAGKSTLVNVLNGAYPDYRGEVLLNGRSVHLRNPNVSLASGISVATQEPAVLPDLSIAENIFVGAEPSTGFCSAILDRRSFYDSTARLLKKFEVERSPQTPARNLSRNETQAVHLIKAIRRDADVLVLDEPSTALTQTQTVTLTRVIRERASSGACIVFISHRLEEVLRLCDIVAVLRDGVLVSEAQASCTTIQEIQLKMFGELAELSCREPERGGSNGKSRLAVTDLSTPHWSNVTFSVSAGEIVALLAASIEPVSELLLAIYGAHDQLGGSIALDGEDIRARSPSTALTRGIGYVSDDRRRDGIFANLSVTENITISVLARFLRFGILQWSRVIQAADRARQQYQIKAARLDEPITFLSGGNQQKSVLARLLLSNPRLLLLHEPFAGIDIAAKGEIIRILNGFRSEGKTILIASTEPEELEQLCDRFIFLRNGTVSRVADASTVSRAQLVEHLTGLSS